jgi:hypothetical protein
MTLLNVPCSGADLASRIVELDLLQGRRHLAKKVARLLVVIVVDTMVPMCGRAFELQRRLVKQRLVGMLKLSVTGVPDAWANGGRLDWSFMGRLRWRQLAGCSMLHLE